MKKNTVKTLTQIQQEILVGSLLGDGALARRKENINARYHVRMGLIHETEIMYLYEIFKDMCQTAPKITTTFNLKTNKEYKVISFMTLSYPCLNYYRDIFYVDGIKKVPLNIKDILTCKGLAQWIMDDGGADGNGLRLYTNSFTIKDVELLKSALFENFNIKAQISHVNRKRNPDQYKLYVPVESMDRLRDLVKDYILPSMHYKLNY